ncbi:MAG: hypothetical protein QHI38_02600 [Armatimonadota bacterium]|nr:hypothetical protein [Armatimonadota bacterium]
MTALVKTDSSQTKTVIVLVAVLVITLGVLGYRIRSRTAALQGASPAAVQASQDSTLTAKPGTGTGVDTRTQHMLSRNPFAMPSIVRASVSGGNARRGGVQPLPVGLPQSVRSNNSWVAKDLVKVLPVRDAVSGSDLRIQGEDQQLPAQVQKVDSGSVKYVLLATVTSDHGCSALIQSPDSVVRAVDIGDVLENGFRVVSVSRDEAVLTNGKQTIVARRPG